MTVVGSGGHRQCGEAAAGGEVIMEDMACCGHVCYSISTYYLSSYLITSCLYVFKEKVPSVSAGVRHMIIFV